MRAVALVLDTQDVGGALVRREQIRAVLGFQQRGDRLRAGQRAHDIVVRRSREHRRQHVMTRALRA